MKRFLKLMTTAPLIFLVSTKVLAVDAKVLADGVEVRQEPDDKSPSVATLKKGDDVTASDRKGTYWKVKLKDGKEGYVSVASLKTSGGVIPTAKDAIKDKMGKTDPNAPKESTGQKIEKGVNKLFKK